MKVRKAKWIDVKNCDCEIRKEWSGRRMKTLAWRILGNILLFLFECFFPFSSFDSLSIPFHPFFWKSFLAFAVFRSVFPANWKLRTKGHKIVRERERRRIENQSPEAVPSLLTSIADIIYNKIFKTAEVLGYWILYLCLQCNNPCLPSHAKAVSLVDHVKQRQHIFRH